MVNNHRVFRQGILVLLCLPLLTACATSQDSSIYVTPISHAHYAPSSEIQTLTTPPSEPYITIARLQIKGAVNQTRAQLLTALVKKAGAMGGNILLITREKKYGISNGPISYNPAGGSYEPQQNIQSLTIDAEVILKNND